MTQLDMAAGNRRVIYVRTALLGMLLLGAASVLVFIPRFAQDTSYHNFADQRTLWNVPHALNVVSNLPFVLFGLMGMAWLLTPEGRASGKHFLFAWEWRAQLLLFCCLALTGVGSAYYHADPNNSTLYWDRLPLTVVFMTFFVLVLAERTMPRFGAWLLVVAVAFGVFGVTYWHWTEQQGVGDVRVYALVQFFPLATLPILLLLFPARYTGTASLWGVLAWYALAKLLEHTDSVIYTANGIVSGHTLKHLVASLAGLWLLLLLKRRQVRNPLYP